MKKKLTKTDKTEHNPKNATNFVGVAVHSDPHFEGILKNKKGITLIALIITIIVMLILVAVSVTVALNGGLFETAKTARDNTLAERQNEEAIASEVYGGKTLEEWAEGNGGIEGTPVDPETSYVGYFAKVGNEYGIIYADLAVKQLGTSGFGQSYTIPTIKSEESKTYYVAENTYTDSDENGKGFGPRKVIVCANPDDTEFKDRFYVMALSNFGLLSWSEAGVTENDSTGLEFGDGIDNTVNSLKDGWFVPSMSDWAAFIGELTASGTEISISTYDSLGLRYRYWTSSHYVSGVAWYVTFLGQFFSIYGIDGIDSVRLGTTF